MLTEQERLQRSDQIWTLTSFLLRHATQCSRGWSTLVETGGKGMNQSCSLWWLQSSCCHSLYSLTHVWYDNCTIIIRNIQFYISCVQISILISQNSPVQFFVFQNKISLEYINISRSSLSIWAVVSVAAQTVWVNLRMLCCTLLLLRCVWVPWIILW